MARNRRYGGGLIPGVILIVVGALFLFERFDLISMRQVWRFWPLFIIWLGLSQLIHPGRGRRSIFLLLIGIWLQISTLELWGLDFGESWPLAIIAVGASFVFDALIGRSARSSPEPTVIEIEVDASTENNDET